jgi:hypothetical protein
MVARVSEDRLASCKATLADVEKRVACEMAAKERALRQMESKLK